MLLFYGLSVAPGECSIQCSGKPLVCPPPAPCLHLGDCPSAPEPCLLGTLVLAGERIRSGEWLPNLLMPSLGDHQDNSIS